MSVVFFIAAAVAVLSVGMMLTRTKAAHALLYLVVAFLALGLVFYTLGAPFIAALQVIIYAGAIMVLFLFALMLLHPGREDEAREREWLHPRAWALPAGLAAVLLFELVYLLATGGVAGSAAAVGQAGTDTPVKAVGVALLGPYLLGVELASILLLAGLVAAHRLAARDEPDGEAARGGGVGADRADEGGPV